MRYENFNPINNQEDVNLQHNKESLSLVPQTSSFFGEKSAPYNVWYDFNFFFSYSFFNRTFWLFQSFFILYKSIVKPCHQKSIYKKFIFLKENKLYVGYSSDYLSELPEKYKGLRKNYKNPFIPFFTHNPSQFLRVTKPIINIWCRQSPFSKTLPISKLSLPKSLLFIMGRSFLLPRFRKEVVNKRNNKVGKTFFDKGILTPSSSFIHQWFVKYSGLLLKKSLELFTPYVPFRFRTIDREPLTEPSVLLSRKSVKKLLDNRWSLSKRSKYFLLGGAGSNSYNLLKDLQEDDELNNIADLEFFTNAFFRRTFVFKSKWSRENLNGMKVKQKAIFNCYPLWFLNQPYKFDKNLSMHLSFKTLLYRAYASSFRKAVKNAKKGWLPVTKINFKRNVLKNKDFSKTYKVLDLYDMRLYKKLNSSKGLNPTLYSNKPTKRGLPSYVKGLSLFSNTTSSFASSVDNLKSKNIFSKNLIKPYSTFRANKLRGFLNKRFFKPMYSIGMGFIYTKRVLFFFSKVFTKNLNTRQFARSNTPRRTLHWIINRSFKQKMNSRFTRLNYSKRGFYGILPPYILKNLPQSGRRKTEYLKNYRYKYKSKLPRLNKLKKLDILKQFEDNPVFLKKWRRVFYKRTFYHNILREKLNTWYKKPTFFRLKNLFIKKWRGLYSNPYSSTNLLLKRSSDNSNTNLFNTSVKFFINTCVNNNQHLNPHTFFIKQPIKGGFLNNKLSNTQGAFWSLLLDRTKNTRLSGANTNWVISLHTSRNLPFILSATGFLFLSGSDIKRTSLYKYNKSQLKTRIKKHHLSFLYKEDLKRIYMRRPGFKKISLSFPSKGLRFKRFFLKPELFSRIGLGSVGKPSPLNNVLAGRYVKTPLHHAKTYDRTEYFINRTIKEKKRRSLAIPLKRIRFKPGYQRIWRRARASIDFHLNYNCRYQAKLTKKLSSIRREAYLRVDGIRELFLFNFILTSRFVFDIRASYELIATNTIFVNGIVTTNPGLLLIPGDFLQLYVSLKFYITYKWLHNFRKTETIRFLKLMNYRNNTSRADLSKQASNYIPDWVYRRRLRDWDLPKYVEVDFFTLSSFVLFEPMFASHFNRYTIFENQKLIYPMYNWKYIN